jgi:hypothetical protein
LQMQAEPMMTLREWLTSINDDYLVAWANKGLLRRGYKLLTTQNPHDWTLNTETAQATLDGTEQHLDGIGFESLRCGCPSVGPCHHLIALLLGLKQRQEEETAATDSPQPEGESAPASPWLLTDMTERQILLGKSHLQRARRWLAQGLEGTLIENVTGLNAELPEPLSARVVIPRGGGIAMSLCSCKEPHCAHRALVVLQACRDAGMVEEEHVDALTIAQREVLEPLNQWIRLLVLQGMSGIPHLHIERAHALVTELQQVDLPLPARQLARVAEMLEQEWRRHSISSPSRLREALAMLLAHVGALERQPLPQPLANLAGSHRRRYSLRRDLDLVGLAAEVWETLSGYRGYSVYFYAPEEAGYYQLSEARKRDQEPNWLPEPALAQARLGKYKIGDLIGARFRMQRGWCSRDRRFSIREDCQLSKPEPLPYATLLRYSSDLPRIAQHLADKVRHNTYGLDLLPYAITVVDGPATLLFDHYQQRWQGEAKDLRGRIFKLSLSSTALGNLAAQRLQNAPSVQALFGRWHIEETYLCLEPIAVWQAEKTLLLTLSENST